MHAFILTTTNFEKIAHQVSQVARLKLSPAEFQFHPDLTVIEGEKSISIAQIRQLKTKISRKPLRIPLQIVVIFQAQKMTHPAQNAFLKIFEEPNAHTLIFLALDNPYQLLPTVLSRSQIINITPEAKNNREKNSADEAFALLEKLLQAGVGERLGLVEPISKNRAFTLSFVLDLITSLEGELHLGKKGLPEKKLGKILLLTSRLKEALDKNLNVRLSVDHWALAL